MSGQPKTTNLVRNARVVTDANIKREMHVAKPYGQSRYHYVILRVEGLVGTPGARLLAMCKTVGIWNSNSWCLDTLTVGTERNIYPSDERLYEVVTKSGASIFTTADIAFVAKCGRRGE